MQATENLEFVERTTGVEPTYSVIWLHGLGADGYDFEPLVPELNLPADKAVKFIFPHAPRQPVTINGGMVMRAWYDITGAEMIRQEDDEGIRRSAASIRDLIQKENARGITTGNIILAGFSQGGAIALHTGLRYPESLAGILALSTYLPLSALLDREAHVANQSTPIFMAHGLYDPVIPLILAESSRTRLQRAGYNVEWHSYPMPHAVSPEEIRDISHWFRQRLGE
jgi:phospholipase/carboxylesterase